MDPLAAGPGGFLHTQLAAHPLIWGTDACAGGLSPHKVLEILRPVSESWREPFGIAAVGANTAIVEAARPRGTPPNYKAPGFSAAQLRLAMEDEVARGWSIPVPPKWPKASLRRSAPCKLVPKSGCNPDGSPRSRLVQDNTAASSPPSLRGINGTVDTSLLEFPAVPSPADICKLICDAAARSKQALWLSPMDIRAAYKQLSTNAGANPLLTIAAEGSTFMNVALGMGARFSAPALCAVTASLADALRTVTSDVTVYADDILLVSSGSSQDAALDRERAVRTCNSVGLPIATEKTPDPSRTADFVGLRFCTYPGGATVSVKPSTLDKLMSALASVRAGTPISKRVHEPMLGRAYWLSVLCIPLRAWIRRLAQELIPAMARAPRRARWSGSAEAAARSLVTVLRQAPAFEVADVAARAEGPDRSPRFMLATDASGSAGGAVLIDLRSDSAPWQAVRFEWPGHIDSSTRSELLTAVRALQHFAPQVAGHSVRLLSDNMATVAAAARFKASLAAVHANDLAEELALFLLRQRVRLDADHLPGVDNVCADRLSRLPLQVATGGPLWTQGMSLLSTAASSFFATPRSAWRHPGVRRALVQTNAAPGSSPVGTAQGISTSSPPCSR